jgi:hypothetical protein
VPCLREPQGQRNGCRGCGIVNPQQFTNLGVRIFIRTSTLGIEPEDVRRALRPALHEPVRCTATNLAVLQIGRQRASPSGSGANWGRFVFGHHVSPFSRPVALRRRPPPHSEPCPAGGKFYPLKRFGALQRGRQRASPSGSGANWGRFVFGHHVSPFSRPVAVWSGPLPSEPCPAGGKFYPRKRFGALQRGRQRAFSVLFGQSKSFHWNTPIVMQN